MVASRSFRVAVAVIAAGVIAPGCASAPPPAGPAGADPEARTLAVADAIVDDVFEHAPDLVARLLPPGAHHDKLPDESRAARQARDAREDAWAAELGGIDRGALRSAKARLAYDVATETLAARREARVCRYPLWSVGQMSGLQVRFANLAQVQPVGTETARREALARFAALPAYVATQIDNLREGLGLGYTQAAVNVKQVIAQLDRLLATPPDKSPYASPAERDADPAFRAAWLALVQRDIDPALARYRDFLRDEYLPRARAAFGVSANPDGAACYRAAIRSATTLPLDPAEVHRQGERELARIREEMRVVARRAFGTDDLPAVLKRLSTDPAYLHRDRESVTAQATQAMARAKAALPRAFGLLPRSDVTVEPIPAYQERTAAAHYLAAALDGSRPATYRIRLFDAEKQSVSTGESTAFHEAVPGHHLQIDIALQRADNPRIARFVGNGAFSEGWALYAERLADELGLYGSDVSRLGWLSNAAWRAVRLVVDSGIHAFGWDRQRAIDALRASTVLGEQQAAQEIDRYISWPAQATSYMVGYLEIARLRAESERRLGERVDLRAFHDRVLENGSVPLPVLRRHVEAWLGTSAP
jgi:uncharacterized protein (DUF885 family)